MLERVDREIELDVVPAEAWQAVAGGEWLADEAELELEPGGEARFVIDGAEHRGWVEEVVIAERLVFWWAAGDEPATRVEVELSPVEAGTRVRVTESRPLAVLDVVGIPVPGGPGSGFGPVLIAA